MAWIGSRVTGYRDRNLVCLTFSHVERRAICTHRVKTVPTAVPVNESIPVCEKRGVDRAVSNGLTLDTLYRFRARQGGHTLRVERIFFESSAVGACVTDAKKRRDARFHWKIEPRTSRCRDALAEEASTRHVFAVALARSRQTFHGINNLRVIPATCPRSLLACRPAGPAASAIFLPALARYGSFPAFTVVKLARRAAINSISARAAITSTENGGLLSPTMLDDCRCSRGNFVKAHSGHGRFDFSESLAILHSLTRAVRHCASNRVLSRVHMCTCISKCDMYAHTYACTTHVGWYV